MAADLFSGLDPKLHLVLIDGSGFIFRAYHALPPMNRADGTPVNAVFGFTNMIARLQREHVGTHIAVIFDAGRLTFRNRISADYKAHRPEPPDDLIPQFALVREATAAFALPAIELADWEADDLIASYARAATDAGGQVTIVSSDKDLMQLVRDGVGMLDPIKQKPIGAAEVVEKFGVPPAKLVEVQALMGDSVDNVPGVPGIGPKGAAQLILEHGDVEGVLAAAPAMKPSKKRDLLIQYADQARLSRRLVELREDAPLPLPIEALHVHEPERETLAAWLTAMGFRSTAARLGLLRDIPAELQAAAQASLPLPPSAADWGASATITTVEALAAWCAEATLAGAVGLEALADGEVAFRANLLGVALAVAPGRAAYVPIGHASGEQLTAEAVFSVLGPLLADPAVLKVVHDAKDAATVLAHAGHAGPLAPFDDVLLIDYAQEAGRHDPSLESLAQRLLDHALVNQDGLTGTGRARLTLRDTPVEAATAHAGARADAVLRLWQALRPALRINGALAWYEQVERRLVPILLRMEQAGIAVDADDLRAMSVDFGERLAAMEVEIGGMAGGAFNIGSPKQLGEVLFDRMGLPGGKRTKAGAWGTDASVLTQLAEQGHDLPGRVLEWRQVNKLKTTYADSLVNDVDPRTGRVHTSFAMAATSTGRISSNDPNLQNIPIRTAEGARIRHAFVAAPGHLLVSCDYSQIELRLLAHVADIPVLRESFRAGEDIHARTASEVFGVPMAQMDGATRRRAKAINFGIIYGISAFGLGRQLGIEPGEAKTYIDAYFVRYPGIRAYMEATREEARMHGYVRTPFGRRCWIPGIADRNPAARGYAERQASNAPLQGGAADIIKRAMVRLPAAMEGARLTGRLLLQVHDELLFEAPEAEADPLAEVARGVMQGAASLSVPLVVETGRGRTWGEAH